MTVSPDLAKSHVCFFGGLSGVRKIQKGIALGQHSPYLHTICGAPFQRGVERRALEHQCRPQKPLKFSGNYPSPSPHHMPPCLVAYLSYTSHRHAILCFRTNTQDGMPMRYSDDLFDLVCLPCHPIPPIHRVTCLCRGFVEVRS